MNFKIWMKQRTAKKFYRYLFKEDSEELELIKKEYHILLERIERVHNLNEMFNSGLWRNDKRRLELFSKYLQATKEIMDKEIDINKHVLKIQKKIEKVFEEIESKFTS